MLSAYYHEKGGRGVELIAGVATKKLKVIPDERGYLMEMLRADDSFYQQFGQAYLTAVYPGVVKGWHRHLRQFDHIVCVRGMIKLVMMPISTAASLRNKAPICSTQPPIKAMA